jgi:hypothetical protein
MSTTVIAGHTGNFSLEPGAGTDYWEDILGSATATMTGQVTQWELTIEQEEILHTPFVRGTSGQEVYGKQYYQGRATATCHFEGAYPSGHIFAGGAIVNSGAATTNYQDLLPGTGATQATGMVTLKLTNDTIAATDKTITMTGSLFNIRLGVNRRSGLNTISGDVIGEITAAT